MCSFVDKNDFPVRNEIIWYYLSTKNRNEKIKCNNNSNNKSKLACELRVLHNELELSMLTPMLLHLYFSFVLFLWGDIAKWKKMSFQS